MTTTVRISQKSAVHLEHARRYGFSDQQLLEWIASDDMAKLQAAEDDFFQYEQWVSYAKEYGEDLASAIQNGYRMTFSTVYGVKRWLEEALGLDEENGYVMGEGRFDGLRITRAQAERLKQTLANNWVVLEQGDTDADEVELSIVMRALLNEQAH